MVVVSRWYGGIHLGPDRFKHINNCTRMILEQNGYIKEKVFRNLDKSVYQKIILLFSHPKHMLWVLKRTVSMRRFF